MPNASTLQFLLTLAKGIASQFGPNCEVVVHDLATNDPERSIVAIENGHVTGRKVGDGPSHVVLEALRGNPEQLHDHLSYLTRTKDGKILKSTTIYIRDDDGAPIGIFGINYDITLMLAMENAIKHVGGRLSAVGRGVAHDGVKKTGEMHGGKFLYIRFVLV